MEEGSAPTFRSVHQIRIQYSEIRRGSVATLFRLHRVSVSASMFLEASEKALQARKGTQRTMQCTYKYKSLLSWVHMSGRCCNDSAKLTEEEEASKKNIAKTTACKGSDISFIGAGASYCPERQAVVMNAIHC